MHELIFRLFIKTLHCKIYGNSSLAYINKQCFKEISEYVHISSDTENNNPTEI